MRYLGKWNEMCFSYYSRPISFLPSHIFPDLSHIIPDLSHIFPGLSHISPDLSHIFPGLSHIYLISFQGYLISFQGYLISFQTYLISFQTRSLHSPPFSGRTPGGLRRTQPIQNANFLALELLELSGDFPVTFRCMLAGLVSPTDFPTGLSAGMSPNQQSKSTRNNRTKAESPTEVRRKSSRLQRTPTDSV